MRKLWLFTTTLFCFLIMVSTVKANPSSNLRVVPVGAVETGDPIVTQNPATLMIYSTGHQPITKIWLILVTTEYTYDNLVSIVADSTSFSKGDFAMVVDRMPPVASSGTYPGCQFDDQYPAGPLGEKLNTTDNVYYAYKEFSISTVTRIPQEFDVEVEMLVGTHGGMKVLVLANGYWTTGDTDNSGKLNEKTPWSGSTIIVPELSTILMALTPLSALALYKIRRRNKNK